MRPFHRLAHTMDKMGPHYSQLWEATTVHQTARGWAETLPTDLTAKKQPTHVLLEREGHVTIQFSWHMLR
jgi:hypothetical protein